MFEELQLEIKQTKPFRSHEEAAYLAIQKIAEDLRAGFNDLFKTRGLTGAQYNVLRILRGAGHDGLSCREISERMITRDSDITRMLDRLEASMLICRERQADDRRVVLAFIADQGLEILADLDGSVDELQKKQLGHMSGIELESMIKMLVKAGKGKQ